MASIPMAETNGQNSLFSVANWFSSNRSLTLTSRTFFLMRRAVCLELTSCICHRKPLTVCFQI